jgi:hypothetical protein
MIMGRMASLSIVLLVLVGCGEEPPPPWTGTYVSSGTWNLSGPLAGGRTVGDATADFLLDKIVSASPVPSFLEDDLRDWLEGQLRAEVKTFVDENAPKDLAPDGALTKLLSETLTTVQIASTIRLDRGEDDDELTGEESITGVAYTIRGQLHQISMSELGTNAGVSIGAQWAGKEPESGKLVIDPHSVNIRYGQLVRLILVDLLQAADLSVLDALLASALSCEGMVALILDGRSGFEISIAGFGHTIGADDLADVCSSALEDRVLGQLELDTRVEVGGTVTWTDSASKNIELKSGPEFGGVVNLIARAFAPKVGVSFTAQRQ